MLNIAELERRWLRYKIKSLLPYVGISFTVIVLFILYILLPTEESSKETIPTKKDIQKKEHNITIKQHTKKTEVQPTMPVMVQHDEKTLLKPSMKFLDTIKQHTNHKIKPNYQKYQNNTSSTQIQEEKVQHPIETPKKEKNPPASHIIIKRDDTQKDIQNIIKRFKKNHNPALSLFVARKYYELGHYKQAYNYALITNKINANIEGSWLIFAKSLVKMNQKEKAIKTLQTYINYSNSHAARILLNNIMSGKFQ